MAIINGTPANNVLNGTPLSDVMFGFGGNDIMRGFAGNDAMFGGTGNDLMFGGLGVDRLSGQDGNDRLFGDSGNDGLSGGNGNDSLNGGTGADHMAGGTGHDLYFVDNVGDRVVEFVNQGIDRVHSTINHVLSANVENLTLFGGAIAGIGNNVIAGTNNANVLSGLGGQDVLLGLGGNDTLLGGFGLDQLRGGAGNDRLIGGAQRDILLGEAGADRFTYLAASDSQPVAALRDRIVDFNRAQGDRIDVSAIDANTGVAGNQAFFFGGFDATPASGPATGVLNWTVVAGQVLVRGNIDADAAIELEIHVTGPGVPPMLFGDFIL
ncbi:MAG TPA: calcium-binding protein [Beijerinckiaceae bacterium]|jgi:Ca2+-binding RTX toxin-like protein